MNPIAQVSVCVEGCWKTLDLYPLVAVWPSLWPYYEGEIRAGDTPVKLTYLTKVGTVFQTLRLNQNEIRCMSWGKRPLPAEIGILAMVDKQVTHDDSQGEDVTRGDNDDG